VNVRMETYETEKAEETEATAAIAQLAEEAMGEADEDWSGEMDFQQFVQAFMYNPRFLRKVSMATGVPVEDYQMLQVDDLADLFNELDADFSGTISFDEFVKGLVDIRIARQRQKTEEDAMEQERVVQLAFADASQAFDDADMGYKGELDPKAFAEAMMKPEVQELVVMATKLPMDYFAALDAQGCEALFREIDTDDSGTVSFEEWVTALVRTRLATYAQEKVEAEEAAEAVAQLAEEAMDEADEDWSGEFEFDEFLKAFRQNEIFLRKVSKATGVPVEEFTSLADDDLEALFDALDTDFSGTVSFEEFTSGLVEIRLERQRVEAAERAEGQASPKAKKSKKKEAPPYELPKEVKELPALSDIEKEMVTKALAKYESEGVELKCNPENVMRLLQDLYLISDHGSAKRCIETAFPGRNLSYSIKEEDWYALYQVGLTQQPVWTKPLKKSVSDAGLNGKDLLQHESTMRGIYDKFAGKFGAMQAEDVGKFFAEAGILDNSISTPRLVNDFRDKRMPGPVYFPEVVDLCNTAISSVLRESSNPQLAALQAKYPKRAYALAPLGKSMLGTDAAGSPALAMRQKQRQAKRGGMNMANPGRSVVAGRSMGKSASTGALARW